MIITLRRAVPVLAAAALLVSAFASTADAATAAGHARPLSLRPAQPGPAVARVPAGFQPASASFLSPASGVVLGTVGCRSGQACAGRLAATANGGGRWRFLQAPDVQVSSVVSGTAVSSVVFASRRDGWLYERYGRGLWATHDRGGHWRKLSLGGDIEQMAASAGTVYAVVGPHGGNRPWELFASPAGRNAWARVGHFTGSTLAVSGKAAWFGSSVMGSTYLRATADGVHWHRYPFRCRGSAHIPYYYFGLVSIAAASPSHAAFLCMTLPGAGSAYREVLRSTNGGRTAHLAGPAQYGGDSGVIAGPPQRPRVITLATSDGDGVLYHSANGGKTWKEVFVVIGGASWSSLSYVSPTVGWFVVNEPTTKASGTELLRTSAAGATWHQIDF